MYQTSQESDPTSQTPQVAQAPVPAVLNDQVVNGPVNGPVNGQIRLVSNPVGSHWVDRQQEAVSPEFASRLNMYLSEHIETSSTGDIKGMLPYSRLAGFDSRRPKAESQ